MTLYEAIFKRRSVRRYKKEPLPPEFFKNLRKFELGLQPLNSAIPYSVEIIDALSQETKVRGLFRVKAPYYLVFFSEPGEEAEKNAGYLMEQLVLYLTEKGVGTCYQGLAKLPSIPEPDGLKPLMVLAFGYAEGELYRESFKAKRLSLKELCVFREPVTDETRLMMQAARLAPSAMNGQPWRFMVYQNRIHVFAKKERLPFSRFTAFDIGIVLCHISLAAEEVWRDISFERREQIAVKEFKNNQYFLSIIFI